MILKTTLRLKKESARFKTKFFSQGASWVYSNEVEAIDTGIEPGAWAALEDSGGRAVAYGHFNPHSLIAFRVFERAPFVNLEKSRALFVKRMDDAWTSRIRAYSDSWNNKINGRYSLRLCFGESDGLPGLVIDLFESTSQKAQAIIQCHSAGADNFINWTQSWLSERLGIDSGIVRNDLEVRERERAVREVIEWGSPVHDAYVFEGGVRFNVDLKKGQKTGFFYDLRDARAEFAKRIATFDGSPLVLDCFSFIGAWGLQVLKKNKNARLIAVDVSKEALSMLERNARENDLSDRVEVHSLDLLKTDGMLKKHFGEKSFDAVVVDPPSMTASAKQAKQGYLIHEKCFREGMSVLKKPDQKSLSGLIAIGACSYHLGWDDFLSAVAQAGFNNNGSLRLSYFGSQSADHPALSGKTDSRYIKCVMGEWLR